MALINRKTHETKILTGKGKYIVMVVDKSLIKPVWRLNDERENKYKKNPNMTLKKIIKQSLNKQTNKKTQDPSLCCL